MMRRSERIPTSPPSGGRVRFRLPRLFWVLALGTLLVPPASALNVTVVDEQGNPVTSYRWTVEEDAMYHIEPGVTCMNGNLDDCLSVKMHKSSMPIVATGVKGDPNDDATLAGLPTDKRYFISVLPGSASDGGASYTLGGAHVDVGQTDVEIVVSTLPLPTAQIRVFAFEDKWPINNAPDLPFEDPRGASPMEGWRVLVEEAGGRYGISGGQVLQDAFGNPLGTTYVPGSEGQVLELGTGVITLDKNGVAEVKNLAPGKYGIQIVPPAGSGWLQTTTIEGTHVIDAWVKAHEPPYLVEFGPPGPHIFMGFVNPNNIGFDSVGTGTIQGQVRSVHLPRPPDVGFFSGRPFPSCLVALNDLAQGGKGVAVAECDEESNFRFDNVPAGTYQMVIWDKALDIIIDFATVIIGDGETISFSPDMIQHQATGTTGTADVFPWFARTEFWVFYDKDQDGFRDCYSAACDGSDPRDEIGISNQNINLRFRDGSVYQAAPTDNTGYIPFDEIFPFFDWLIAEVDFARFKATGATFIVDEGGKVDLNAESQGLNPGPPFDWTCGAQAGSTGFSDYTCPLGRGMLTPQPQCGDGTTAGGSFDLYTGTCTEFPGTEAINPNTGNNFARTETGPVLTQAFDAYAGNTNIMEFGKAPYARGENGGIAGIVFYAVTRAEDDPAYAVGEPWEPGIARIPVNLYRDSDRDGRIDDLDGDGTATPADIDNYPFGWRTGGQKGSEDFDLDGDGTFDYGDVVSITSTDSFDDNAPTGCQGDIFRVDGLYETDCYDNLRSYNQVRPGVFDGGYAFDSSYARDDTGALIFDGAEPALSLACEGVWPQVSCQTDADCVGLGGSETCGAAPLASDTYIVEVGSKETGRHPAFKTVKEEDRNVDFGETYEVSELLLPPPCVGERPYPVPDKFSLFDLGEPPFRAGLEPPMCDRKQVELRSGMNAAADFFLFTDVPIAAHIVGLLNNDVGNERNPQAPLFAEKFAPAFVPVSIRDWRGNEIVRTYSDRWGKFNLLVPATFTASMPMPSGMSPNMLIACMNDPGPIPNPDPNAQQEEIIDPYYSSRFTRTCYTFNYMPGTTTYLDTPIVRSAAFAERDAYPVDCALPNGTPEIYEVNGPGGGPYAEKGDLIEIISAGVVDVPDPRFDGQNGSATIARDYRFGGRLGTVSISDLEKAECASDVANKVIGKCYQELLIQTWTANRIVAEIPTETDLPKRGQLVVTKSNGISSQFGITMHIGGYALGGTAACDGTTPCRWVVEPPAVASLTPIQDAIDAANAGDLILVRAGTYEEMVILWKPVELQGSGAWSTKIFALKSPGEKIQQWRDKVAWLTDDNPGNCDFGNGPTSCADLLPAQKNGQPILGVNPGPLTSEEGPGVMVLAKNAPPGQGGFGQKGPRVDGFAITSATQGGGIVVNGYVDRFVISNNRIFGNNGLYNGGIRVGHPFLTNEIAPGVFQYQDGFNTRIQIRHNQVFQNGGLAGAGGGISIHHGSDRYEVTNNFVCGNFTLGEGAGIGHLGTSDRGLIANNTIAFNQNFNGGVNVNGGGIYISGGGPPGGAGAGACSKANADACSPGSGSVVVDSNRIVGNHAGAGNGGGIALERTSGADVAKKPNNRNNWWTIDIVNNMISNNVAGRAGGGISLFDAPAVNIINNTIIQNDATATVADTFPAGNANQSRFQPAGVVSYAHSPELNALFEGAGLDYADYSKPDLVNDIIFNNRTFYWSSDPLDPNIFGLVPDTEAGDPPQFWDLGVVGVTGALDPQYCLLSRDQAQVDIINGGFDTPIRTCPQYANTNICRGPNAKPVVRSYYNGDAEEAVNDQSVNPPTTMSTVPATAEGGNFIDVSFGPLTLTEPRPANPRSFRDIADLHERKCSPSKDIGTQAPFPDCNAGLGVYLCEDFDDEARPWLGTGVDIGADESYEVCPTANEQRVGIGERVDAAAGTLGSETSGGSNGFGRGGGDAGSPVGGGTPPVGGTASAGTATAGTGGAGAPAGPATSNRTRGLRRDLGATLGSEGGAPGLDGGADAGLGTGAGDGGSIPVGGSAVAETAALDAPLPVTGGHGPALCSEAWPDPDNDGLREDPFGNEFPPNAKCMRLTGGDGFAQMADGQRIYTFGFRDVTGLCDTVGDCPTTVWDEGFLGSETPAPTIYLDEGDQFYLGLTNVGMQMRPDLFDPHSVHFHGFPNASAVFDGVPEASIVINMGATLTYYYNLVQPGTYMYHCHVEATEHMQMGMLGNLYVHAKQDKTGCTNPADCPVSQHGGNTDPAAPLGYAYNDDDGSTAYDVEYPIQIGSFDAEFHLADETVQPLPFAAMKDDYGLLNGRGYPDTVNPGNITRTDDAGTVRESQRVNALIEATQGQRVLLRISNLNVTRFYTLTAMGLEMEVVGKDAKHQRGPDGKDLYYKTATVTLGGGESIDVIIDTTDVEPGTYYLYTTNLNYLSNYDEDYGGMMTEIVISAP